MREQTLNWMRWRMGGGEPVKGVTDKMGDMVKLCNAPYERAAAFRMD